MNQPFSQEGMMAYTWTVPERPRSSAGCCFRWWLKLEEVEPGWSKLSTDNLPLKGHLFSDPFFVVSVQWWALSSPVPTTLMTSPSPCSKQLWSESSKPWAKANIFLYVPLSGIWSRKLIEGLVFFPSKTKISLYLLSKRMPDPLTMDYHLLFN